MTTLKSCSSCLSVLIALLCFNAAAQEKKPLLEEIIVTAEKRSESLQDLSQAVTALSGEDIDDRNITSFVDLSSIAPGVTVAKNEGFKTVIAIRGVGNEANQNAIANPSVSYHLDGIYVASPFALHTDFLDLERIEVLRGPQGTLFGQNSTGGAINVITQAPDTEEFSGKADITVGNYSLIRARGSVNVPVSDTVALRASIASHNHDGFSRNIVVDQGLDQANSISARARLLWAPMENLRFNFTARYYDENTNGAAQKGILDSTPNPRRLTQDWHSSYELESQLYSLVAEWDSAAFTVRSLTSYQDDDIAIVRDNDRHDFVNLINQGIFLLPAIFDPETNRQKTFTQELNLISAEPLFGRLDWVAGVFYLDTEVDILIREYIDFNVDGSYGPGTVTVEEVLNFGGEVGFISDSKPERDSVSVYGQGTFHLTDSMRLIAGLRYTDDEVYSEVTNFFGRGGTAVLEVQSEKLTGRGVVEFDLNDDTMVYASYTRGFKPGGSNLTYGREDIIAPIVVLPTFKDETVDAWELGVKTDFADNRVRLNAAAFYYEYKNLQYQATDPELFEGGVGNLPESEIYGAELELLAFITDRFTLDARLSWLETEISESHLALDNVQSDEATNALLPQCNFNIFCDDIQRARAEAVTDVKGNELAKTPNFTADVMLRYSGRLGSLADIEGSVQYIYRDGFQHRIFNNPKTDDVPSYDIVNLMLTIRPDAWPWYIDLMGMNLADEDGINARFTDVFGVGATGDELIAPRQYMVRFGMEF
ncbi:MAG: TonB-dependent receptor [Gammaproteobacteria bacterium]|nr:TonB-dependent receptor [Gammaproteobacteria bacterium]